MTASGILRLARGLGYTFQIIAIMGSVAAFVMHLVFDGGSLVSFRPAMAIAAVVDVVALASHRPRVWLAALVLKAATVALFGGLIILAQPGPPRVLDTGFGLIVAWFSLVPSALGVVFRWLGRER